MQFIQRLAVVRQAPFEHLVIRLRRRGHEAHAEGFQGIPGFDQVIGEERDVLNTFAVELHQKFFDLARALGGLLVQRDADHAVRSGHGFGGQAGVFALDVEIANFSKVEQLLVEVRPIRHATAIDVVGQVVDELQARPHRMTLHAFDEIEVDVIDRRALTKPVDQVQRRTANALDCRQTQLHRARGDFNRLRAQLQRTVVGFLRILDPKRHTAHRRAVLSREVGGDAVGLAVEDEIDLTLTIERHVLGAVIGNFGETHDLEHGFKDVRGRRGEFDEFKAHQAHRVFVEISHGLAPCK